ncbi:sialidase family protein [uncultured Kriegella sp.]|uniref:sialidase family protein n=1 Tax=uncultured Kriegella sp. TaxID=1798910 RepID=UPI0030D936E1|tara:strand:- start:133462 stop:134595 length:1134 start_codon:yes stop_codon:yes gene_type:complete
MKKNTLFILIVFFALSVNAQDPTYQMAEGIKSHQDLFNTSMNDSVSCYRIPALVTAPNGDLIAAIDERVPSCNDLRGSDDINIVIRRSDNNGKTWGPIETVIDFPIGQSASDPSMIVDEITKEIFLFYNFMNLNTEKDIYYLHVMKSSDNGKTWSEPKDITSQIAKPEWHKDFKFITSGRGIQTSTGKLLHCMANLTSGMHVFGSDDHGKTWFLIDTPISPADESKIVELADGSWMINSRANKKGLRYIHTSTDEGKTWVTKPDPTLIDPSCNASIIRYTAIEDGFKKNRLLFSNAKTTKGRTNLTIRVSYDEGKTWTDGKTIYKGPSAYSSLTVLKNGDIGVFFEKDEYTKNEFASLSLKWLTDKKDSYKKPKKRK